MDLPVQSFCVRQTKLLKEILMDIFLCREGMARAGVRSKQTTWTDFELREQIIALNLVIAYFNERNGYECIVNPLRQELIAFERMWDSRGQDPIYE